MSDTDQGLSATQVAKQIDASLARLKTDYVDLYQAHRFDPAVPIEETIEAFQKVVEQGKARYLGFSEWTLGQIQTAIEIAGPDPFVSSQPQYSMLRRPRSRSSRPAPPTASPRSSGRRSHRASSPASTSPASRRPATAASNVMNSSMSLV